MLGKQLGHYTLEERLGAGGMGEVYAALDRKLHRRVALKILPAETARNPERRSRFEREAKAIASLNHPGIVTIHSVEEEDGIHFITMELVVGKTLSELIPPDGLTLRKIFEIAMPLLDAVSTAHEQGIVHRDLKPDNIMITDRGRVKVLDFGLAKLVEAAPGTGGGAATLVEESRTQEGRVMGTSAYMSPEQAEGKEIDHRTDIFSLGIVLYEMATGRRPFRGDTGLSTLSAILRDDPPPVTELKGSLPNHLGRVIQRCLAKDPRRRYQTALDVENELEIIKEELESSLEEQSSLSVPSPGGGGRRPGWLPWAGIGLGILVAAGIWFLRGGGDAGDAGPGSAGPTVAASIPPERKSIVVFPFENLGAPDEAYFAAGITEEITSRLARVGGLSVMSRTSATQYDKSGKAMPQIGEDLGVTYVLDGTVRWERHPDGTSRVRVTPQLISTGEDRQMWSESYDRSMEEIFRVQSEIAEAVVRQLDLTLAGGSPADERPTDNMDAYHAFLRANDIFYGISFDREGWDVARGLYERAIELDPEFLRAYCELSQVHSGFVHFGWDRSPDRLAKAKAAADRATALDPDSPWTRAAWGYYHYWGRKDYPRALEELEEALRELPSNAEMLRTIGWVKRRQGDYRGALAAIERSLAVDPRSVRAIFGAGETHRLLGEYAEAETYFNRGISLAPDGSASYFGKAWNTLLWTGDVNAARATLESCPVSIARNDFLAYRIEAAARRYPEALLIAGKLDVLDVEQFAAICRPLLAARVLALMDRPGETRAAFDSARVVLEAAVEEAPGNAQLRSALGLAYAGLGRKEEAVREGRKALELMPRSRDTWIWQYRLEDMAWIHTMVGDPEAALDELERLASRPNENISPPWLRIVPWADPLRGHPRFRKLVDEAS